MRRLCALFLATAALLGTMVAISGPASATSGCMRVKPKPDGYITCFNVTSMSYHSVRVEAVPVRNYSKVRIHASCKFTTTVSRGFEAGLSYTASAKATIVKLVDLGGSWTAHLNLSMTAQTATEVAGDFYLNPGQSVTCIRTYGYVTATVSSYDRWDVGAQIRNRRTTTVKVPSRLGALFL